MALIPFDKVPGDKPPPLLIDGKPAVEYYCGDPHCDCLTGHLVVEGVPLVVDVGTGRIEFLDQHSIYARADLLDAATEVVRSGETIDRLRAHYVAVREFGAGHHYEFMDWSSHRPGEMVPWDQIFAADVVHLLPVLKQQPTEFDERGVPVYSEEDVAYRIALADFYCVDARCDCQRVLWSVSGQASGDREPGIVRPLGHVMYDFRKQEPAVRQPAPGIDPDQLLYTVIMALRQFPGIVDEHAERYQRIRQLIIPLINKQRREREAVTQAQTKEIGRNEPCPCGSGKKYKKCHGAK